MQEMTHKRWKQLKARAEAGDPEAQWEVGSWLEDGLADPKGFVFVHPDARAAARWFRRSAIAGPDVAYVAMMRKLFFGSSVRYSRVITSPRAISRTCTRIGETIVARCSGISVRLPAATGTLWLKWGADFTQASVSGATRNTQCAAFVRPLQASTSRKQDARMQCSTSAPLFMKGVA
jgi:hypothetical protein